MATGKVKWFNNAKGYGFIRPDEGGDDLFVHFSYIDMDGYKSLRAGQEISYTARKADKGTHAVDISFINENSETSKENGVSVAPTPLTQPIVTQQEVETINTELEPA
ncbi:MAG: cold shock domain-containing protein [Pseudomonadales bacterium]|nr:cold shock domain-containing protein [Pseudomonadales bacterium]